MGGEPSIPSQALDEQGERVVQPMATHEGACITLLADKILVSSVAQRSTSASSSASYGTTPVCFAILRRTLRLCFFVSSECLIGDYPLLAHLILY